MSEKHIKAWHFCADGRLRDGQKVVVGKTYTVKGPLVMCEHGLHWSRRIIDALQYAPGSTICLVEAWGDVQEQADKGVSTYRKVLAKVDGEKLLRLFACDCAEETLRLGKVMDNRNWQAVEVARKYANGKATKKELAAARDTARSAARDTAMSAVWDAAWAAAWDAAWAATRGAAIAARGAAWDAAMAAQNDRLTTSVLKAMKRKSMDDGEVTHGPA